MGHYKGKREASQPEHEPKHFGAQGDPFQKDKVSFREKLENAFLDINWFFHSKKGKALVSTLCILLVIGIGATVAIKHFVKPPELPPVNAGQNDPTPQPDKDKTDPPPEQEDTPPGPTDDELYPDDGYGGDMPEIGGERKKGVYTFLLVGTDRDDGNTDTIMVVSYDTVNQLVNVMSIPRDTMINVSWDIKKINSIYSRTGNSITELAKQVQKLIGFRPDCYVKVELSMFVELVDLVGGVEFNVPQDMQYEDPFQDLKIDLKKGVQVLDGDKAMQLVRFRGYSEGDIRRVAVQQDFLKALIKECLSLKHWGKIKSYIDLAMDHVETDLEFGNVVWFAANVLGLNEAPMLSMSDVNTCTIPGNYWTSTWSRATEQNQSYVTIYSNKVVKLVNESFNPYLQDVTAGMIDAMSILENGDIASSTGVLKDTRHNEVMAVRRGEAYFDENDNIVYGDPNEGEEDGEDPDEGENPDEGETTEDPIVPEDEDENTDDPIVPEDEDETGDEGDAQTGEDEPENPDEDPPEGENTDETDPGTDESGEDEPQLPDEPTEPETGEDEPTEPEA